MKNPVENKRGFTLLEVLIAMAILAIVCAIVYGSFYAVTESTIEARAASERAKTRQFVLRNLRGNLEQIAQGWLPGAADRITAGADEEVAAVTFGFTGKDERGSAGPADSVEFVSLSPMPGALVLPGTVKRVKYEVTEDDGGRPESIVGAYDPENPPAAFLQVTEVPITLSEDPSDSNLFAVTEDDEGAVRWLLPIRSMDIRYFDGKDWKDDWDGDEEGRLPWALDVRINLPSTAGREDEDQFRFDDDREEGPNAATDIQLIASLPSGVGINEPPPTYGAEPLPGRRTSLNPSSGPQGNTP